MTTSALETFRDRSTGQFGEQLRSETNPDLSPPDEPFEWSTPETFQVVNVLTCPDDRYAAAQWTISAESDPSVELARLVQDIPVSEPIDLEQVDWSQVIEAIGSPEDDDMVDG